MKVFTVILVFLAVALLVYQNIDLRMQLADFENNMIASSSELEDLRTRYARGREKYQQLRNEYNTVNRENRKLKYMAERLAEDDEPEYKKIVQSSGFKKIMKRKRGKVNVSSRSPISRTSSCGQ